MAPDINPSLPAAGQPNATEEPKIVTALSQLVATINDIDNANIAAGAGIVDTKLASPNNATWRTLAEHGLTVFSSVAAGTYIFVENSAMLASGSTGLVIPVYLDPAEFVVAGKTPKLRLRVATLTAGAPGVALTFGIYGVAPGGAGGAITVTASPSAIAGSVATVTPAATSLNTVVSSIFDFPAVAGWYAFGIVLAGPTAASTNTSGRLTLQVSHQ